MHKIFKICAHIRSVNIRSPTFYHFYDLVIDFSPGAVYCNPSLDKKSKLENMHYTLMAHPLSRYIPIADAVSLLFQPSLEVVLHDIIEDKVFYIANAFSGRKPGDVSLLKLTDADLKAEEAVIGPYEKAGEKGQRIRSVTAVLRDDTDTAIGLMCINLDFSVYEPALALLENLIRPETQKKHPEILFQNDWRDQIKFEIRSYLENQKIALFNITPAHRKKLMAQLDAKGLFYAKKALEQVAGMLNISRATAYNDLNAVRKQKAKTKKSV